MQEAYLTITRISGDPDELVDGYRETSKVMEGVGRDHGLILHAAAPTDDGLLVVNLWPSKEGSESAARDQRRLETIKHHDLTPDRFQREHHEVADYVVF